MLFSKRGLRHRTGAFERGVSLCERTLERELFAKMDKRRGGLGVVLMRRLLKPQGVLEIGPRVNVVSLALPQETTNATRPCDSCGGTAGLPNGQGAIDQCEGFVRGGRVGNENIGHRLSKILQIGREFRRRGVASLLSCCKRFSEF